MGHKMAYMFLIISLSCRFILSKIKKINFISVQNKFNDRYVNDNLTRRMSNFAWKIPQVVIPYLDFIFSLLVLVAVFNMIFDTAGFEKAVLFGIALISVKLSKK